MADPLKVKESLLQSNFIDCAVGVAKIQMDETLTNPEKQLRMEAEWRKFKRFIDENYTEK